jgi:hypothetical protein
MFMDGDGRVVIGTDGKAVTYEKGQDGVVKWSANASKDVVELGNAMLTTNVGEQSFNRWQNAKTEIKIVIDKENAPSDRLGQTSPEVDDNGDPILNSDKQFTKATVTIYEKSIKKDIAEGSNKRFEGASYEEALGTVGTHEEGHNQAKQIKLDLKIPKETKQDPAKNVPINSEVDFRQEYQGKHPEQKAKEEKGMKVYKDRGYEGTPQKK